jgi:hypothetical protein
MTAIIMMLGLMITAKKENNYRRKTKQYPDVNEEI